MNDVIDFRFRPVGARSWNRETTFHYLDRMGLQPTPSFEAQSLDLMFQEMDEAGIAVGVIGVPGPTDIRGLDPMGGEAVSDLIDEYPGRFVAFGSVEPSDVEAAASSIREMGQAGVKGVTIDPSTAQIHRQFHDRALYPLYEEAAEHAMLVTTTQSCLLGPYMEDCRPEYVDRVATDFPNLQIVIQHGGWPYVHEAIGVLYKQPNVFMVPGQYVHYGFPGSAEYVEDLMFEEMDEAGIAVGVIGVPGPTDIRGLDPMGGEAVSDLIDEYPGRFVAFGSVEPSDVEAAASSIREMGQAGVKGVTIDPSTAQIHRQFHDRALYPLYEEAAEHAMLVTTTQSCLLGPYMEDCRPEYVDRVATDFPNLQIVIQHGGWPYVHEAIGVLYKQPNVFMVPGQYVHYGFPGSAEYVEALRRQCSEQIIFGSVYPNCGSLAELRTIISSWELPEEIERRYLRENAASLLDL